MHTQEMTLGQNAKTLLRQRNNTERESKFDINTECRWPDSLQKKDIYDLSDSNENCILIYHLFVSSQNTQELGREFLFDCVEMEKNNRKMHAVELLKSIAFAVEAHINWFLESKTRYGGDENRGWRALVNTWVATEKRDSLYPAGKNREFQQGISVKFDRTPSLTIRKELDFLIKRVLAECVGKHPVGYTQN